MINIFLKYLNNFGKKQMLFKTSYPSPPFLIQFYRKQKNIQFSLTMSFSTQNFLFHSSSQFIIIDHIKKETNDRKKRIDYQNKMIDDIKKESVQIKKEKAQIKKDQDNIKKSIEDIRNTLDDIKNKFDDNKKFIEEMQRNILQNLRGELLIIFFNSINNTLNIDRRKLRIILNKGDEYQKYPILNKIGKEILQFALIYHAITFGANEIPNLELLKDSKDLVINLDISKVLPKSDIKISREKEIFFFEFLYSVMMKQFEQIEQKDIFYYQQITLSEEQLLTLFDSIKLKDNQ